MIRVLEFSEADMLGFVSEDAQCPVTVQVTVQGQTVLIPHV